MEVKVERRRYRSEMGNRERLPERKKALSSRKEECW